MSLRVGVIGQSQPDGLVEALAYEVGQRLAGAGCVVYCGGLGGVMEAVCRGAAERGGLTVGILPTNQAGDANPFVRVPVVTGMGEARNVILVKSVDAVIAIGKGYGTLSELAIALRLNKRVALLRTWEVEGTGVRVSSAEEAVAVVLDSA